MSDDHSAHGPDEHEEHIAHILPAKMLIGIFIALIALTFITVGVHNMHLGTEVGLITAMVIASIKAALVMLVFMHLLWERLFNVVLFVASFLFVLLFLALAIADRAEYQPQIDSWVYDNEAM